MCYWAAKSSAESNRLLERLLQAVLSEYEAADQSSDFLDKGTKRDKLVIKKEIFAAVRASGGRFLKKQGGAWLELTDRAAIAYLNDRLAKVRSRNKGRKSTQEHIEPTTKEDVLKQAEPQRPSRPSLPPIATSSPSQKNSTLATSGSGAIAQLVGGSFDGWSQNGDPLRTRETSEVEGEDTTSGHVNDHHTVGLTVNQGASFSRDIKCGSSIGSWSSEHHQKTDGKLQAAKQESPLSVLQMNAATPPFAPPLANSCAAGNDFSRDDESIDAVSDSFSQLDLLAEVATGKRGRSSNSTGSTSLRPPCARPRTDPFISRKSVEDCQQSTGSFAKADISSMGYLSSIDGLQALESCPGSRQTASSTLRTENSTTKSVGRVAQAGVRVDDDENMLSVASSGLWSGNPPLANVSIVSGNKSEVLSGLSSCRSHLTPQLDRGVEGHNLVGWTVSQNTGEETSVMTTTTSNHLKDMRRILREMRDKPDDVEVQLRCCGDISRFLWENDIKLWGGFNRRHIAREAIEIVLRTLKHHFGHDKVPAYALETIQYICKDASQKLIQETHTAIIDSVVDSMHLSQSDSQVQQNGCYVLGTLAKNSIENCRSVSATNGIPLVVSSMVQHSRHARVQEQACFALCELAQDLDCCKLIGITNGIVTVVATMRKHREDQRVQVNGCAALSRFVQSTDNCRLIENVNGAAVVLEAIKHCESDVNVQVRGLFALSKLAEDHRNKAVLVDLGGILVVFEAMQKYFCYGQVQSVGCLALSHLVRGCNKSREVIVAE